jgi:murein L,D-transpeptidase YafK
MASLALSNIREGQKGKIPSALPERERIRRLLENWLKDWSAEDQKSYFSHYHPNFRLRNLKQDLNLESFKRHKTLVFNRYSDISIGVRNLKINVNRTQAEVTFIQDFRSRQYQDRGLKKLVLVKFQENWRIKEESWREMRAGGKP